MIDVEQIEDLIFNHVATKGCPPKYILLDKRTHDEFSKSFHVKEKISGEKPADLAIVSWNSTHSTKPISILCVDTHDTIFEAVQ